MPNYRLSDADCVPLGTLNGFRSRIPKADQPIRIGGPLADTIRRLAEERGTTADVVVQSAIGALEKEQKFFKPSEGGNKRHWTRKEIERQGP